MNHTLYYTVEGILADLNYLICHNKTLSPKIIKFYLELQGMHTESGFENYIDENLTAEILAEELYEEYQDMLEIYFDDILIEANEKNII
jgi:hypothetical protein